MSLQSFDSSTPSTFTLDASRSCSICKRDLTDAASVETGVGPICRQRSNDALARSFPASFAEAFSLVCIAREKGLLVTIPPAQATLDAIGDAFLMDPDAHDRQDWRTVIKQCEWILSHKHIGGRLRCFLHDLAEALGYHATVALWRGEMVIGKATLTFSNGLLTLRSPRPCADVRERMREEGWRFNPTSKGWSLRFVSTGEIDRAELLVRSYFFDCDTTEALADARDALRSPSVSSGNPPATPPSLPLWERRGNALALHTPYNAAFVQALKTTIPPRARQWVAAAKEWVVNAEHEAAVVALIGEHFKAA